MLFNCLGITTDRVEVLFGSLAIHVGDNPAYDPDPMPPGLAMTIHNCRAKCQLNTFPSYEAWHDERLRKGKYGLSIEDYDKQLRIHLRKQGQCVRAFMKALRMANKGGENGKN